jgi:hypothetical protein
MFYFLMNIVRYEALKKTDSGLWPLEGDWFEMRE